jgi:septum formation protein
LTVNRPRLILASASPRRCELLASLGLPFEVRPSHVPEVIPPGAPREAVTALALAKACAVARTVERGVVLGADTAVVLEGVIFGKPDGVADARRMLQALRGRRHEVITGLALVEAPEGREESTAVVTGVRMAFYDDATIEAYLATGEPFDKAGAYAIQGAGGRLVEGVEGCYTNVVGLPVTTTRRLLLAWGLPSP